MKKKKKKKEKTTGDNSKVIHQGVNSRVGRVTSKRLK